MPNSESFQKLGHGFIPDAWPTFFHTRGDIVTVSPAEIDGGVKHVGHPFP
jgi:hypothetical protein